MLAEWALTTLGLERLELLANPKNEASQRLAERAGFTREGVLRRYRRRHGVREDLVMYSLLAEDLDAVSRMHETAAIGFARSAEAYELGRPGYPAAALEPLRLVERDGGAGPRRGDRQAHARARRRAGPA